MTIGTLSELFTDLPKLTSPQAVKIYEPNKDHGARIAPGLPAMDL